MTTKRHSIRFKVHWEVMQNKLVNITNQRLTGEMQNLQQYAITLINNANMTKGQDHLHKFHKHASSEKPLHDN